MRAVGTTAPRWWTTLLVWRGGGPQLDETSFLRATPTAPTRWMTGLVDPGARPAAGPGGRPHQAAVDGWLQARPRDWLAQVGTAAPDPRRGYASALVTPLGHATVVGDHFHAIRLANAVATRHADS